MRTEELWTVSFALFSTLALIWLFFNEKSQYVEREKTFMI